MISILDTTLREGEQTPGVYFPEHVKFAIARHLNNVNVDIIEAGHPVVSDEIFTAVKHLAGQPFSSKIAAHSRTVKNDVDSALECGVKFLGIFYCVSDERLEKVFNTNLNSAVNLISEIAGYAKSKNPDLILRFTPEDTVRSNFENVVTAASEAVKAGADIISVADTTGYMIPHTKNNMYDYISRLKEALAEKGVYPEIAVHCHNDRGLALANAIESFRAGAGIIDASVLGIGERAGIVDLATLLAVLTQGLEQKNGWDLKELVPLYRVVSRYSGLPVPVNFPVTGKNAFRHCAGVHTHAAQLNPLHYQSLDPEPFGREMEISLDHMSGFSSVLSALEKLEEDNLEKETVFEILKRVKKVGQTGRTVGPGELKMITNWTREQLK